MFKWLQELIDMYIKRQWYIDETKRLTLANQILMTKYEDLEKQFDAVSEELATLNEQLKPDKLEEYWNNKRPTRDDYIRPVRTILNQSLLAYIDPRMFFYGQDTVIPSISTGTNDEKAYAALREVIDLVAYTSDTSQFKNPEEWLFAHETVQLGKGDCEDGAILLANIMLKSGIPYWRIRLNAGDVNGGGHCWVTYLRESDNQWVILDWCYWPTEALAGLLYKDAENYFNIWFSWNTKHIYLNEEFERENNDTEKGRH